VTFFLRPEVPGLVFHQYLTFSDSLRLTHFWSLKEVKETSLTLIALDAAVLGETSCGGQLAFSCYHGSFDGQVRLYTCGCAVQYQIFTVHNSCGGENC
jgi:hypothetical protein